jgi:hypothetical protein
MVSRNKYLYVRVIWLLIVYSLVDLVGYRRFREECCLHFHGRNMLGEQWTAMYRQVANKLITQIREGGGGRERTNRVPASRKNVYTITFVTYRPTQTCRPTFRSCKPADFSPSLRPWRWRKCEEFWIRTQHSTLKVKRRFGRTYLLRLYCWKISQERNQHDADSFACCLLHAGFLFGLLFNSEDGGDIFLRKVCIGLHNLRGIIIHNIPIWTIIAMKTSKLLTFYYCHSLVFHTNKPTYP